MKTGFENAPVVIITGSSGLIGAPLVRRLSAAYRVVGFDRDGHPHPPPEAECVCVDLRSDESIEAALDRVRHGYGTRIASVVHLAAYYDFSVEESPLYREITVRGTERLLRALDAFEVEQFLFSSTMLVHAPRAPGEQIDEDSPLDPKWPYPESKVETEKRILELRKRETKVGILRIAGVYDEGCHSIPLAHQIDRIYRRALTSHLFPGDAAHGQAFVHLDDVIDAIVHAVDRREALDRDTILLLGEPETFSHRTLQSTIGRLLHGERQWTTREIPKSIARAGAWFQAALGIGDAFIRPWMIDIADDHYELDISRARDVLEWKPRHRLLDVLPAMIAALRADPVRWFEDNELSLPPSLRRSTPRAQPTRAVHERLADASGRAREFAEARRSPNLPLPAWAAATVAASIAIGAKLGASGNATPPERFLRVLLYAAGFGYVATSLIDFAEHFRLEKEVTGHVLRWKAVPPGETANHAATIATLGAALAVARPLSRPLAPRDRFVLAAPALFLALGWRDELVYHRRRALHREDILHTVSHLAAATLWTSLYALRLVDWRAASSKSARRHGRGRS